jgi:hypothetical protein
VVKDVIKEFVYLQEITEQDNLSPAAYVVCAREEIMRTKSIFLNIAIYRKI